MRLRVLRNDGYRNMAEHKMARHFLKHVITNEVKYSHLCGQGHEIASLRLRAPRNDGCTPW